MIKDQVSPVVIEFKSLKGVKLVAVKTGFPGFCSACALFHPDRRKTCEIVTCYDHHYVEVK